MLLRRITFELLRLKENSAYKILGDPDYLKLKSSMTLFAYIDRNSVFMKVLDIFFNGEGR